ncbi:hypothetical protein H476_3359, partial [[Clostridium] sordellii VPI 9048]
MSCRSHPLLTPGGGCGARKYVNNDTGLLTVTRGRDILQMHPVLVWPGGS